MKYAMAGSFLATAALCLAPMAHADPIVRTSTPAGSVIARKSGEEVRFVDISDWRYIDLNQDLLDGDVLRTNATGQLAVLFSDRTQVRLGRNTSLLVKKMGGGGDTGLELQSGTIWARAERGGQGLTIDTPAAAAAIRGTDWTLSVGADGKTALNVLEGVVELKNAQGSVRVTQGEGAVAAIGQAPRKIVVVNSDDREQMLYYLSLREAFNLLPASNLKSSEMRAERQRIEAIPQASRTAADWLTLAEVQLTVDGRRVAVQSQRKAQEMTLSPAQKARADLIEGMIAGAENRYDDASRLFRRAAPHLDGNRRTVADYGGYYARSLANPARVEKPPANGKGPNAAIAEAYTAGFLQNIRVAVDILKKAEARYPDNATLPAVRAKLSILLNDRDQAKEAIDRALLIDPQQAIALDARADYRANVDGDIDGALADLKLALRSEPGNDMVWNTLGLVEADRDANRAAEKAFLQSIALDPEDALGHVNLALLYLNQLRVKEAKEQIDLAMKADPGFDLTLIARGRYHLQVGEMDKAVDDLLAGSVANPAFSQGQLLLAAALYDRGDRDAYEQAIDNAERLDPNDPIVSSFRTAIAIDDYDADGAIRHAQEFLRRARARGGDFGALSANQDAGSVLNDAFRLQGLDAWGQYYGDAVFNPFTSSSYIDQYVHGSVNPFANSYLYGGNLIDSVQNGASYSSYLQGLLLDPHILSASERKADLLRYPFVETSLGGGFNTSGGDRGWNAEAQIQGYANTPVPISFLGNLTWEKTPDARDIQSFLFDSVGTDSKVVGANGYLTATVTPDDRVVVYTNYSDGDSFLDYVPNPPLLPFNFFQTDDYTSKTLNVGLGWSHSFDDDSILNAALFYGDQKTGSISSGGSVAGIDVVESASRQRNYIAALSHTIGDDDLTWRYGLEGGRIRGSNDVRSATFDPATPPIIFSASTSDDVNVARAYVDALYNVTPSLQLEGALFGNYLDGNAIDKVRLEPRAGVAWAPTEGQWLRAAYMREGYGVDTPTLSPIGVLGLQANQFLVNPTGYADTFAARWDAQWSDRFFTAVDFQHQELHDLEIASPLSAATIDIGEARIDRASVTANVALGYGFGLSATAASANSESRDVGRIGNGEALPFVPEKAGQVALTWVNEANVKATLAANYTGSRNSEVVNLKLDDYWTLDANVIWEPFDKRFALELAAFNLLDEDFDVGAGTKGWGRSFKGTLKVRF